MPHIITRRSFLNTAGKAALGVGLASLTQIPPFLKRALAEGNVGINGKKLIFIFLRGGNDGVNNVVPVLDPSYRGTGNTLRNLLAIPTDPLVDYAANTGSALVAPIDYPYAVPLGNGFAALNPALRDLAPIFNTGRLAIIHRVGYRGLSRSHFDSEKYWEKGADGTSNSNSISTGVWYRTIVESGYNRTPRATTGKPPALSGVSVQSNMPQSLRGEQPMTNLSSISRYNLLGVYSSVNSTNVDRRKILDALDVAYQQPYPAKDNRDMVHTLGVQFRDTLDIFQDPAFQANTWFDDGGSLYPNNTYLFPSSTAQDQLVTGSTYRVGSNGYGFMSQIKSCAQLLNSTDAIITGTEIGGWDTHTAQVTVDATTGTSSPHLGGHASLLRRVAAAYYALWRYFALYGKGGAREVTGAQVSWNDVVVVTMSEFGRTSLENDSAGTDHGESSVMYVAGGGVTGGVYGCSAGTNPKLVTTGNPNGYLWEMGNGGKNGALYTADTNVGYLRRTIDYRSVIGEIIRDHLGATQPQLNRIIPAYANESTEHLLSGGTVGTTPILGELGIV